MKYDIKNSYSKHNELKNSTFIILYLISTNVERINLTKMNKHINNHERKKTGLICKYFKNTENCI